MLPQRLRLQNRNHFAAIYSQGRSCRGVWLSLRYLAARDRETLQMTVVVSRKVAKRAVQRNRIKRRLRAAFGVYLGSMRPGFILIWTVRQAEPVLSASWPEVLAAVKELLEAAKLWRSDPSISA